MLAVLTRLGHRCASSFSVSPTQASEAIVSKTTTPRPKPDWLHPLPFGKYISDHMLEVNWSVEHGWSAPEIKPYQSLKLDPAISAFHYAVESYEEMEAVKSEAGKVLMFRPDTYMERLAEAGQAVCLPEFSAVELTTLIKRMVALDQDWVPQLNGYGLYLRVNFFSNHNVLGVTRPLKAKITAYGSPHSPWAPQGLLPVRLFADETVARTWPGGVGKFKIGANYACGIWHTDRIRKLGYQHMLWSVGKD